MKNVSVFLIIFISCNLTMHAAMANADTLSQKIHSFSARYLNYNCSHSGDSVLFFCSETEKRADLRKDLRSKFRAQQVAVNALCLRGDIGLGIATSGRMYEEAKGQYDPLVTALAVQSFGATYLHSGEYRQALETFAEAEPPIRQAGDTLDILNLTIQQLHAASRLPDTTQATARIAQARHLLPGIPAEARRIYRFYLDCYQSILLAHNGNPGQALRTLDSLKNTRPAGKGFDRWLYYTQYTCQDLVGNPRSALAYNDSLLTLLARSGNRSEYYRELVEKARLLETAGEIRQSCDIYEQANALADSLNILRYAKLINALHMAYWIDRQSIDDTEARNRTLAAVILCGIGALLGAGALLLIVRRKNRQIAASRNRLAAARETAADSIQSKSMFLSNMSHELRTPLNAIVGFCSILTDTDQVDSETKQLCRDNIRQNSDLLLKLVDDVVDFSSLKDSKIRFSREQVDAVALCRNVLETVGKVKQTSASLIFSPHPENLELYTDKGRLQQVLINLLVNATKFTRQGTITLGMEIDESRGEAVFWVQDTGCGIPPEKQARIFERFEKLHEGIQGVGLGLSICQLIVDHMGGRIWIDAGYTDGARFVFTHPLDHNGKKQDA